jgi:glycine/D-amino acid oxidase-like deaminating enzyme
VDKMKKTARAVVIGGGVVGVTLWKGFQRRHAQGMTLQHQAAAK